MRPVPPRRWLAWLLVLVLCTGLGMPAVAGVWGGDHHAAGAPASHAACLHAAMPDAAVDAASDEGSDPSPDRLMAADCALAHLGQAVLDPPSALFRRVAPFAYPPVRLHEAAGRVPGPDRDPPREARTV